METIIMAIQKQEIFDYVHAMLGGGMVDVELDPIHYETALKKALTRFRQRSDNSVEESYFFMPTIIDQNEYTLPNEIMEVRKLFRRSVGARSGGGDGGSIFEPFNLAYTNAYLLSSSNIEFKWNSTTKKLTLLQRPRGNETLLLYCYNYRPDEQILNDYLAQQWIKDYTLASCKYMLGEAREKFATIAGPSGGTSLNGQSLKSEAQQEMEKLEQEVSQQIPGGVGYSFLIG